MITEKKLLKLSGKYTLIWLAISLFFWFVIFGLGICHAQTQTGYRIPPRQDIGGGRMTGDMWCQYGTNGVRFIIGTQAVTQVGTTGVLNGTNTNGAPSLDFTYGGGSISANFNGFNAVYVAGSQVGTSGAMLGKLDAVGGIGTTNTFNSPTLAGVGTITASFGANGLVITEAEYASVNNATGELQSQIDGKQASLVNNSPGTITNVLGYTPLANTQGSITTTLGYTPPANTQGSITTALGYTPTNLGNTIELGTETTGNTDNVSEGSTNKYYTDARVNAAVGSLSVNALSDVIVSSPANGQFITYNGSEWINGTSSASVGFGAVTGIPTDNANFKVEAGTSTVPVRDSSGNLFVSGVVGGTTTGALKIPSGTTAQRPASPEVGMIRYNTILGTGGTITVSGSYTVHTFTSSGTFTAPLSYIEYYNGTWNAIDAAVGLTVETLVVAGGGSGGFAGGGGGGVISNASFQMGIDAQTVTIGAGGPGVSSGSAGNPGNNSVLGSLTAIGGGRGSGGGSGGSGGSGGGGYTGSSPGGTATTGQGYNGGNGYTDTSWDNSGGGGGGGAVGQNGSANHSGDGGIGYLSAISGTSTRYAGGGGGGIDTRSGAPTVGAAGLGGGSAGESDGTSVAGGTNTGGGSGGGGIIAGNVRGNSGNGGSGIVIIRYLTP